MRRKDLAMDIRSISPSQEQNGHQVTDNLDLAVLGVCTGTGLGHVDCASVFGHSPASLPACSSNTQFDRIPVPASVRDPIVSYLRGGRHGSEPAPTLDDLLSRLFSNGIKTFCRKNAIDPDSIDLVGTHSDALNNLTALTDREAAREQPLRWNSLIAAETGISSVSDFTITEHAVTHSQIHPTAYVNRALLRHTTRFRVCLNIDEIANLTFIPPHADDGAHATLSRDCGPGSLLIDYAMRYCTSNAQSSDHDGRLGAQGTVNQNIIDQFLNTRDYLRQTPAMSMATEMFGDHEAQQLIDECLYNSMSEADTIATVTRATAQNILKQYNRLLQLFFPPGQHVDELFLCGPSARNTNIVDYLESELAESVVVKPLHAIGIPGDAHEAVCYAHLTLEAVLGQATQSADQPPVPSSADAVRAKVVPGRRWIELMSHVLNFSGGQRIQMATNVRIMNNLVSGVQGIVIA
ncbi:hypothetical protein C7974DRAFT_450386 [Boeremia exigua]|uniref:uncharacterized protein n=1 Tax=Boeremia exigua TaxID=749465 RepID=UPI001E8D6713|nr:uncharacterized protein C7974DRAFT_450386 [Boeremia exigua]KAH6637471.1 hypothetical protein C7974DRAFT_450386 [Boeremia exigua]